MLISYHLMLFTDFVPDIEVQYFLGWSYVCCISGLIFTSIWFVIGALMHDLKLWLHKQYNKCLHKRNSSNNFIKVENLNKYSTNVAIEEPPEAFSDRALKIHLKNR